MFSLDAKEPKKQLCNNGHVMDLVTICPYKSGGASCDICRNTITEEDFKKGFYHCPLD